MHQNFDYQFTTPAAAEAVRELQFRTWSGIAHRLEGLHGVSGFYGFPIVGLGPQILRMPGSQFTSTYPIGSVIVEGKLEALKYPISFEVFQDGNLFVAVQPTYGIDAFAETMIELHGVVADQLSINIREIAFEDDSGLTKSARILKSSLLWLIGRSDSPCH